MRNLTFSKWRHFRSMESFRLCGSQFAPSTTSSTMTSTMPSTISLTMSRLCGLRFMGTAAALKPQKKMPLKPVVGLEIHAQINSKTKLFSGRS